MQPVYDTSRFHVFKKKKKANALVSTLKIEKITEMYHSVLVIYNDFC